ncbi:MAG TPA: hypothetical protein VFB50_00310 [Chloroflexota bacterium]|nr:hypothetical protein [Chloroflexota bacterium]
MNEDEIQAAIQQLQAQQSLQSAALKAALEARWTGEDSVDAYVQALTPGIQTQPETPLYASS